jgi:hypothetical protein
MPTPQNPAKSRHRRCHRAVRQALDTDEFRQAIDATVRRDLDTDEFRQAVRAAVKPFLADARRDAR